MKLILLADVKTLGKKGDLVDVSDGYGQNFLIPRKLASTATDGAVKKRSKELTDQASKKSREVEQAKVLAASLEAKPLVIKMKVGNNGKLFGSVTTADIVKAIKEQFGVALDKKLLDVPASLRAIGEHKVKAKVYKGVEAKISVEIQAEEA
jgi:large subunit ribosomal protein L9